MNLKQRILYPFAKHFFAGTTLADAVARVRAANSLGMGVMLDFLGEDVAESTEAERARQEYARAIEAVSGGPDASLAIKLTHIGLDIRKSAALENALALVKLAKERGVPVWVDMEGSEHTDATIEIYKSLLEAYRDTGIAIQAMLKRSPEDLKALVAVGAKVRLVKGAYNEPSDIAIRDMAGIRRQYVAMMEYLFANSPFVAVGTHDRGLVNRALELRKDYSGHLEFQMLMGMRDDLKRSLVAAGHRVVEYVPYGSDWYGYGMRRLKEKRRNIVYFVQGMVGR